ncbi:hypothetical protein D3C86_752810 [compost metagenome]
MLGLLASYLLKVICSLLLFNELTSQFAPGLNKSTEPHDGTKATLTLVLFIAEPKSSELSVSKFSQVVPIYSSKFSY